MSGAWRALRRLLGQHAPDGAGAAPVDEIPVEEKARQEAETRDYLERARAAERLARIQARDRR